MIQRIAIFPILACLLSGCQVPPPASPDSPPPPQEPVTKVNSTTPTTVSSSSAATNSVTVAAGTRMMVETIDMLDSSRQSAGHRFRAKLVGDMMADGKVVAPGGSVLYGILAEAKKSRRAIGKSEMIVTFTDITINGQLVPIQTSAIKAVTEATTKKSARQVGRAAAIGGLIDGSDGAKTGAAVGAGAAIVTGGNQVKIPPNTLLEFTLAAPLTASIP